MNMPIPDLRPKPWQLLYLFQIGRKSWLLHVLVVTLVYLALRSNGRFPLAWYLVLVVSSAGLMFVSRHAARLSVERHASRLMWFGVVHTLGCMVVGIAWGVGAFEAVRMSPEVALFYSLALGGTTLGAISAQSSVIRSSLTSIWSSVGLLAIAYWYYSAGPFGGFTAGLMVLFALTVSVFSLRIHGFLEDNHRLADSLEEQVQELKTTSAQLEAARKAAADANAAKSRFLAHASHDLRQPLHAIGLLNTNMMHEKMSAQARQAVRQIAGMVDNMSELFSSLLSFSALELGQIRLRPTCFALGELLDEVAARSRDAARQAGCDITVVSIDVWVQTDRDLLLNILQNLVSNAIKYGQKTPITLEAARADGAIALSVSDRGMGIPLAEIGAVFGEYYRLKHPDARSVEGMGLGLTLVKRLSGIMGLGCSLTSSRETGTCVAITGLKEVAPEKATPRQVSPGHLRLKGLRVHVVENDHEILTATVGLLRRWGCDVSHSQGVPPERLGMDILITDYALGADIDGKVCIEQVRRQEGCVIPAIITTGLQGIDLGALNIAAPVGLLAKPVPAQKIRSLILSLLTTGRALAPTAPS